MRTIKILIDRYNTAKPTNNTDDYPRFTVCDYCNSELEYEQSDITIGVYGAAQIRCPLCGRNNILDDNENEITLTKDNVKFPTHFHYSSVETGAIDTCNNEYVKECIQRAIKYFRINKEEFAFYTGSGNTVVCVFRFEGDEEYVVIVSDSHYETFIPFESEDY